MEVLPRTTRRRASMVEEDGAAARPRRRSHRRTRSPKTLWSEERLNGQVLISIDSGDESSSGDEASLYCVGVNGAAGFCRSSSSSGSSDGGEQSSEDEGYAAPVVGYRELQGLLSSGGDLPRRPPPQSPVRRQPRRNPPHWKAGCGSMPDPIVIDVDESLPARNGHVNRWDQALAAAAAKRNRTQRRAGPPIVYSVPSSSSSSGSDQEDNNVAEEDDDVVMCVSPTRTITPAPTVNTASSVTAAPPPVVPQQQTALASNAPVADIISTVIASAIAPVEIHAMPIKREAVTTYIEPTIPSQQSIAQAETLPFQIEVKAEPVAPSADVPLAVPVAPSAAPTAPRKKVTQPVTQPVTKVEHTLSVPTPSPRAKKRRARGTQKLSDEDAGFLLFHGDREPTTAGMLRLVIELICIDVGLLDPCTRRVVQHVLWRKFNIMVNKGLKEETICRSEWMKIVLGAEDAASRRDNTTDEQPRLLPRPVKLTVRPLMQYLKKIHGVDPRQERETPTIDTGTNATCHQDPSVLAKLQNRRADKGVAISTNTTTKRKADTALPDTPSAKSIKTSPTTPRKSHMRADHAPPCSPALLRPVRPTHEHHSAPMAAARAGIAVRVQTDLKNAFTTGLNKSVPVGWDPSIKTGKEHLKHVDPLGQMSAGELREHINALRREGRVKSFEKLSEILHKLMADPRNRHGVFNTPVDPEAMDLPTYNEIIKKPMDLGTIDSRLQQGQYLDIQDFIADVRLVFENAMVFNPRTHYIHVDAEILWRKFDAIMSGEGDRQIKRMLSPRGHVCHACMGHTCTICEQQCLQFTLPHLQCSGNCGTDIRKGSIYFVTRDGSRVWCHKCRNRTARETEPSGGRKGKKKRGKGAEEPPVPGVTNIQEYGDLVKKKCEVEVEPWVKCFECDRWLHQICGMYNPVQGIYCANNEYVCPLCRYRRRSAEPLQSVSTTRPSLENGANHSKDVCKPSIVPSQASLPTGIPSRALTESTSVSANADTVIPTCKLSNFIQEFLRRELEGVGETSAAQTLYVRVLSFAGERMVIPEAVNKAFQENTTALAHSCPDRDVSGQVLPAQVPYTSRGIYLFQKHEGLDVCLFGLYVQEFGDDCPLVANRRSVYIAYLDSVRYLTPASARTVAYHFIMMAYFDYVRRNGFERVHIWSCPPQKRISYVFWCRPSFQKTPSAEHLRAWYNRLLDKAKARHIVKGWSTMYDRYFINVDSTQIPFEDSAGAAPIATRGVTSRVVDPNDHVWPTHQLPPLFDGDFIPAELDRILGRIAARNGKVRRSTQYGGKSTTIGSAGGKYGIIGGRAVRIKEEQPTQPQVEAKLREVFDKCQFAVQRLKNDLLVVDLAVDTTVATPCAPQLDVPAWSTSVPRFFGSRFMFHQLCSSAGYQFDTLRRAKHSTMMMLHHYLNEQVPQANTFCAECHLLISHVNLWRCSMCPRFALCDWCHRHRTDRHPHPLELRNVQTHQVVQASELLPPPAI